MILPLISKFKYKRTVYKGFASNKFYELNNYIFPSDFDFTLNGEIICVSNVVFNSCDFSKCNIEGIIFDSCLFNNCTFKCTNITHCFFEDCFIKYGTLSNMNITKTSFWLTAILGAVISNNIGGDNHIKDVSLLNCRIVGSNDSLYQDFNNSCIPNYAPEKGSYIGYKKLADQYIAELLIPEDAKRTSGMNGKCRASKAKVLSISSIDRNTITNIGHSFHDPNFVYKVGEVVEADSFDENRWNECSHGIHHFTSRKLAENY